MGPDSPDSPGGLPHYPGSGPSGGDPYAWSRTASGWYVPEQRRKPGTNGFAVWSFGLGFIPIGVPLSVIFGIVGLNEMRKTGQRGRGYAITGLCLSAAWILLVAWIVLANTVLSPPAKRDAGGHIVASGRLNAFDLRVGDCFDKAENSTSINVTAIPCDRPHDAETYYTIPVTEGAFPGVNELEIEAAAQCQPNAQAYFAGRPVEENLQIRYLVPNRSSWVDGRRTIICFFRSPAGKLTGSVRDANGLPSV